MILLVRARFDTSAIQILMVGNLQMRTGLHGVATLRILLRRKIYIR